MRLSTFAFCLLLSSASAFTTTPPDSRQVDRAAFLNQISIAAITTLTPAIAFADDKVDDLAMPTAGEQKAAEVR